MPVEVLEIAKAELERLNQNQGRYFDWKKRRRIYQMLNVDSTNTPDPRHRYLAIQSAGLVLPLFRPVYPEDALVYDLLAEAKAVLEGRADNPDQLVRLEDEGYHLSDGLGYNFDSGQRDYQSFYAGFAAYKALVEVRHMRDPWEHIGLLSKSQDVMRPSSPEIVGWTRGEDFNDQDWSSLAAFGDTAAAASFAYSTSPTSDRCQPKLYYEFWKWWTEVALPKALAY